MRESGPARRTELARRPRPRTLLQSTPAYVWQGHRTDTKNSAYDGLNRDATIAVLTSGYDKNGNLTNSGTRTYSYDAGNRLTLVGNGTTSMGVAWDPLGRLRATQTSAGVWTYFLYSGDQMIGEYALNTTGAPALRRYVHGPGVDEPLVWYEGAGVADPRWLHADRQGSIIGVSNGAGAVTPYAYGPWGEPSDWTGPRFRYTGQATFPEAQAYHYKARVYDPALGRFLQTDPIGQADDMNLYAYVRGDPVNMGDPDGLEGCGTKIQGHDSASCSGATLAADRDEMSPQAKRRDGGSTFFGAIARSAEASAQQDINQGEKLETSKGRAEYAAQGAAGLGLGAAIAAPLLLLGEGAPAVAATVGTNYGKLGTVVPSQAGRIAGFLKHGVDQAITRGVSPQLLRSTVSNPQVVLAQARGRTAYATEQAVVVLTREGKVLTTYPRALYDAAMRKIFGMK